MLKPLFYILIQDSCHYNNQCESDDTSTVIFLFFQISANVRSVETTVHVHELHEVGEF